MKMSATERIVWTNNSAITKAQNIKWIQLNGRVDSKFINFLNPKIWATFQLIEFADFKKFISFDKNGHFSAGQSLKYLQQCDTI